MRKLHFIVAGPQRTASSWLDRALRTHPQIRLPNLTKETFFFEKQATNSVACYFDRYFPNAPDECLLGEVAPTYFHNRQARTKLKELFPQLRIIILLRNPVERAFSLFRHEVAKGRSPDDLVQAIRLNPTIIESGRYATLCPEWQTTFGPSNVLLVNNAQIKFRPQQIVNKVYQFLGTSSETLPAPLQGKYGEGKVPRLQALARMAALVACRLRAAGFDRVAETGKALGLKVVYSGGDQSKLNATQEQREHLSALLAPDIVFVETMGREACVE
jgi:hypothetical protein